MWSDQRYANQATGGKQELLGLPQMLAVGAAVLLPDMEPASDAFAVIEVQSSGNPNQVSQTIGWATFPLFKAADRSGLGLFADVAPPVFAVRGTNSRSGDGAHPVAAVDLQVATGRFHLPLAEPPIGHPHGLSIESMKSSLLAAGAAPEHRHHVFVSIHGVSVVPGASI